MSRFFLIVMLMIIASCSSDSNNDVINSAAIDKEKISNLNYNTFEGLLAEEPCNDGLNGIVAHIKTQNIDYVCYCEKLDACSWNALTSSQESKKTGDSLNDMFILSSSLYQNTQISSSSIEKVFYSSSDQIESLAELNGSSCLNEVYGDSPAMEYLAQGLVLPIEGTSTSIKCVRISDGNWVWTIVDNANLIEFSSSNSFVFGRFTDPRDSQAYKTIGVKYGTGIDSEHDGTEEIWFAEDLRYCPLCEQLPDTSMLYTWREAMQSGCSFGKSCSMPENVQGLCPDGWLILPMDNLIIQIENEIINQKIVENGASYWDTRIEVERLFGLYMDNYCVSRCSELDCVPIEDPIVFTTTYYSEIDNLGSINLKSYKGRCTDAYSASINVFDSSKHRLRCYKKGRVPSNQTTVDLCWSKYDGLTTKNICDEEKRLGL